LKITTIKWYMQITGLLKYGEAENMADGNIIHVVGTGTIGEPLIGLLCDAKEVIWGII
jgi:hypothetical protein